VQAGTAPGFQRGRVDLLQRHATGRHLGEVVAAASGHRERPLREGLCQPPPRVTGEPAEAQAAVGAQGSGHGGRDRRGQPLPEGVAQQRARALGRPGHEPPVDVRLVAAGHEAGEDRGLPAFELMAQPMP
jgi:hypothetical protein